MKSWDQVVDNYIRVCEIRGISQATIVGRRRELGRWGLWLKSRRPKLQVEEIDYNSLIDYIKSRSVCHSKGSTCSVMSHMRCMGEYLVAEGIWAQNPLRWVQSPKVDPRNKIPRRIDKEHLFKLFETAANLPHGFQRHLWVTILSVLYGTGIRRGEAVRLDLKDWNSQTQTIRIDSQKVNLERTIPVPPSIAPYIEAYLPHRQNALLKKQIQDEEAFFIGRDGQRLTGFSISRGVHRLAALANIPLTNVHQFRHSCASDLLEEGLSLEEVRKILGHSCLATTATVYTHISDPARRVAISLHPINAILANYSGEMHE